MKNGIHSLDALEAEIKRRAAAKEDLIVSTNNLEVVPSNSGVSLVVKGRNPVEINRIAHRQIQGHLKIPAEYYDRMLTEESDLLARNINVWLHKNRENRLVRMMFSTARAFLSDRYQPLENEDLSGAVLPALRKANADVMSAQITDSRLYIKAVDRTVTRELAKVGGAFGDGQHKIVRVASPAVTITNSEVGHSALSVLGGVYDAWCSNLATFSERSTRKYHVGSRNDLVGEETYHLLTDETKRKTDDAFWHQIRDVVQAAFDRARFDSLVDKIEASAEDKIESDDVVKTVSFATKKLGLTDGEGKAVLQNMMQSGDGLNRFGLYNAITRTSTDLEDYERATEFERLGGKVIEMPRTEWRELLAA